MAPCYLLLLSLLVLGTAEAYVYQGPIDTSNGYCEGDYGRIPVGETGYDDLACERITCSQGWMNAAGCGTASINMPGCRLVRGTGHYPDCCPTHVRCDDEDNETE
ncbi:SVWC domain-containing protein [Caerostris darwini]|uniref:SVWC domain-containing protein n=1 Tax=Caerostris darwini TaxID=1538125 RepID=A0AAV4TU39_9ARAC|nr:SVWC domain-containing protein [Caerostris darwini]